MVKKLLVIFGLIYSSVTCAETIKTDVLVIGSSASGISAAIQSARSKVKTILISKSSWMESEVPIENSYPQTGANYIKTDFNLPTGFWGEYCEKVKTFYKNTTGYDAPEGVSLKLEVATGKAVLKQIADTVKGLTIKLNTPFTTIKKNGTGWDVSITENGTTNIINAKVIVDATEKGDAIIEAGTTLPNRLDAAYDSRDKLFRTSIAVSNYENTPKRFKGADFTQSFGYTIPISDVIKKDIDNLLVTEYILDVKNDIGMLPVQMALGQGVGAVAAYITFFKTTTKTLKVRLIQQEILDYRGYLLPFVDIKRDNRYIRAVQQIGATGLLKGVYNKNSELLFMPDAMVTTEEIKPVLTEIYTRAFLWFNKEKPGTEFTVGNLLSLMSEMTLTDPQTLQTTMRIDWTNKFHFTSTFDVNRPVTRLEFAVLVNQFLNPFARTVDLNGEIVN